MFVTVITTIRFDNGNLNDDWYYVVFRHSSGETGIAVAHWNGMGWDSCTEHGQPAILQYFDKINTIFRDSVHLMERVTPERQPTE